MVFRLFTEHKKKIGLLIIVFCVLLTIFGILHYQSTSEEEVIVVTTPVLKGNIEDVVTATGIINPKEYVDVGAQVSGQLKTLLVKVGDHVKQGDLLAEIDTTVYKAKVDASRAQLVYQEASLRDKESDLKLAKITYDRQKNLIDRNATSLENFQNAEASLLSAQANIEMIKANIDQIRSTLRSDEANLDYARIYAPMNGTIVSITARQGQTLNANQSAPIILRIADLSTVTVQGSVSEADIMKLRIGMDVYFKTLGNDMRWESKLDKVEPTPTVTNNVVLYNALFDVANGSGKLMTSMTTQIFFVNASAKDALLIPMSALSVKARTPRNGGAPRDPNAMRMNRERPTDGNAEPKHFKRKGTVIVVKENGTKEEREVEIGVTNRVQAQVLSGVEEGEEIVTSYMSKTQQNMKSQQNKTTLGQPNAMPPEGRRP